MKSPGRIQKNFREKVSGLRCAFTLIELLVVMAIIAILSALLLLTLSRAKQSALRIVCASNEHQIGIAMRLYLDEFHKYPASRD